MSELYIIHTPPGYKPVSSPISSPSSSLSPSYSLSYLRSSPSHQTRHDASTPHKQRRGKESQWEMDQRARIEYENMVLLQKMRNLMAEAHSQSQSQSQSQSHGNINGRARPASPARHCAHHVDRVRDMKRILAENEALLQRIQQRVNQPPTKQWEEESMSMSQQEYAAYQQSMEYEQKEKEPAKPKEKKIRSPYESRYSQKLLENGGGSKEKPSPRAHHVPPQSRPSPPNHTRGLSRADDLLAALNLHPHPSPSHDPSQTHSRGTCIYSQSGVHISGLESTLSIYFYSPLAAAAAATSSSHSRPPSASSPPFRLEDHVLHLLADVTSDHSCRAELLTLPVTQLRAELGKKRTMKLSFDEKEQIDAIVRNHILPRLEYEKVPSETDGEQTSNGTNAAHPAALRLIYRRSNLDAADSSRSAASMMSLPPKGPPPPLPADFDSSTPFYFSLQFSHLLEQMFLVSPTSTADPSLLPRVILFLRPVSQDRSDSGCEYEARSEIVIGPSIDEPSKLTGRAMLPQTDMAALLTNPDADWRVRIAAFSPMDPAFNHAESSSSSLGRRLRAPRNNALLLCESRFSLRHFLASRRSKYRLKLLKHGRPIAGSAFDTDHGDIQVSDHHRILLNTATSLSADEIARRKALSAPTLALVRIQHSASEVEEQRRAAIKIQSLRRGHLVRKQYRVGKRKKKWSEDEAITKVQALQRGRIARKQVEALRAARNEFPLGSSLAQHDAATKIQALQRGRSVRMAGKKAQNAKMAVDESVREPPPLPPGYSVYMQVSCENLSPSYAPNTPSTTSPATPTGPHPMLVLYRKSILTPNFTFVSQTERLLSSTAPQFSEQLTLPFLAAKDDMRAFPAGMMSEQELMFTLYHVRNEENIDEEDVMGTSLLTAPQLIEAIRRVETHGASAFQPLKLPIIMQGKTLPGAHICINQIRVDRLTEEDAANALEEELNASEESDATATNGAANASSATAATPAVDVPAGHVGIWIHIRDIELPPAIKQCNALVALYSKGDDENFHYCGQTDPVTNSTSPKFDAPLIVPLPADADKETVGPSEEEEDDCMLNVYNHTGDAEVSEESTLGSCLFSLRRLLRSSRGAIEAPLISDANVNGSVILKCRAAATSRDASRIDGFSALGTNGDGSSGMISGWDLLLSCSNLPLRSGRTTCNPMVALYGEDPETQNFSYINQTEKLKNTREPAFKHKIRLEEPTETDGDGDRALMFMLYDVTDDSSISESDQIGTAALTWLYLKERAEAEDGKSITLPILDDDGEALPDASLTVTPIKPMHPSSAGPSARISARKS